MRCRVVKLLVCLALMVVDASPGQPRVPRVMALADVLTGTEETEIRWPVGVAAASLERVAVADAYGPKLLLFQRVGVSWSLEATVALPGTPVGLVWDGARYVLSLRGETRLVALREGEAEVSAISLPAALVPGPIASLPSGGLLVFDAAASQLVELDGTGQVVPVAPVSGTVTGLAGLDTGGYLAAIGDQARIVRFDPRGAVVESWELPANGSTPAWPAGITSDPDGRVFVADRHNGRILQLDHTGTWVGVGSREGWDPGLLRYPAGLARLSSNLLLVADQGNGRTQIFRITTDRSTP